MSKYEDELNEALRATLANDRLAETGIEDNEGCNNTFLTVIAIVAALALPLLGAIFFWGSIATIFSNFEFVSTDNHDDRIQRENYVSELQEDIPTFEVVKLSSQDDDFIRIDVKRYGVIVLNYFREGDFPQDDMILTYHVFFCPLGEPRYMVVSGISEDAFTDSIAFALPVSPSEFGAVLDEEGDWFYEGRRIGFREQSQNGGFIDWIPFDDIVAIGGIDFARSFPTGVLYDNTFNEKVLSELNEYLQDLDWLESAQFRFIPYMETVDIFQILGFDWAE